MSSSKVEETSETSTTKNIDVTKIATSTLKPQDTTENLMKSTTETSEITTQNQKSSKTTSLKPNENDSVSVFMPVILISVAVVVVMIITPLIVIIVLIAKKVAL